MKALVAMVLAVAMVQTGHASGIDEIDESGVVCRNMALQVSHSLMHIQQGTSRPVVEHMAIIMQGAGSEDFAKSSVGVAYIMAKYPAITPDIAMGLALKSCRDVEAKRRMKLKQM